MLSVEPGFGNTGADLLAGGFRARTQRRPKSNPAMARPVGVVEIQRLGERHETDAQRGEFLQSQKNEIHQRAAPAIQVSFRKGA